MNVIKKESQFADANKYIEFLKGYLLTANQEIKLLRCRVKDLEDALKSYMNDGAN